MSTKNVLKPFAARLETKTGTLKAWVSAGVFTSLYEAKMSLGIYYLRSEGPRLGVKFLEYRQLQAFYGNLKPEASEIGFWQLNKTPPKPVKETEAETYFIFDLQNGTKLRILELGTETKKLF